MSLKNEGLGMGAVGWGEEGREKEGKERGGRGRERGEGWGEEGRREVRRGEGREEIGEVKGERITLNFNYCGKLCYLSNGVQGSSTSNGFILLSLPRSL